jgi:hypothetical protein
MLTMPLPHMPLPSFAEVVLELWPEDERELNAWVLCLEEHRNFLRIHGLSLEKRLRKT